MNADTPIGAYAKCDNVQAWVTWLNGIYLEEESYESDDLKE